MTHPAAGGDDDAVLASLWWRAVGPPESADDDLEGFVSLGGFSLAAAQLIAGLQAQLGIDIPLGKLLRDNASLADLRAHLASAPGTGPPSAQATGMPAGPAGPPAATPDDALAPSQRRLWLLSQIHPESAAYNVVAALRLSGTLSEEALSQALDDVVERHEALRVSVVADDPERPRLRWHRSARGQLAVRWQAGPFTDEAAITLAQQLAAQPISLDQPPLLRVELHRFDGADALLVLSLHHIVSDQRSVDVVVRDLAACYEARLGLRGPPATLAARLRDHVRAEQGLVGSPAWRADLGYWRQIFADPPDNRPFPFQIGDGRPGSMRGCGHDLRLGRDLSARVDRYARQAAVTPAMIFVACVAAVIAGWNGGERIVIGVPVSRRTRSEEQDLVGFLVETLPVLAEPGAATDLADLVRQVRDRYLTAASHATPTFDAIVGALELPSRPLASPLFRTWFNDLTQGAAPPAFAGLTARWVPASGAAALFDANFYLHADERGYRLQLVRAVDKMPAAVADQMIAQCQLVLEQMLSGSADRPDRLILLTPVAERAWAAPQAPPRLASPDGLDARLSGNLRTPAGELTAAELSDAVDDLARRLRHAGAGPGQVIQIEALRAGGLPLALLATWRAGAVPALADATLPAARLTEIRALVRPVLVVSVRQDAVAEVSVGPGEPMPRALPGASHLLFTSGSGGVPAAVVIPRPALARALEWYEAEVAPGPQDRVALLAGTGHDPVLRDMLVPLRNGGTLIVPPASSLTDPAALLDHLADTGVTILHGTPALLELLLAGHAATGRRLDRLRLLLSGGAPLRAGLVRRLRELTQAAVVNGYGTTETPQIAACYRVLDAGAPAQSLPCQPDAILPLGSGVGGTGLLVVNGDGRPVGVGHLGEIIVRGTGLAAGYLDAHDPDGRFGQGEVAVPASEVAADRAGAGEPRTFRTGDLGRLGPDGLVYFAGRRDRQVMVNGFRVELAEIELASGQLPGVAQAAAGLVDTIAGPALTLHVVPRPGADVRSEAVRAALQARLPRHAVPAAITVVDRLALNANHKVVLRAPASAQAPTRPSDADGTTRAAAATEPDDLARWLAGLIAQVVGREIGPDENFFEAGLDSVLLLHLHAQVASAVPDAPPATAMFAHPNIASFAGYVASRERALPASRRRRGKTELARIGQEAQRRRELRHQRIAQGHPSADDSR